MKNYIFGMFAVFFIVGSAGFLSSSNGDAKEVRQHGTPHNDSIEFPVQKTGVNHKRGHTEELYLTRANLIVFRTPFETVTCSSAQQELLLRDGELPAGRPIYLFLDTPGGDTHCGSLLIDTARGLGRPVHTITLFAASMGFNTAQALGNRYILASGILMAHRARVEGVGGQVPGEFLTAVANILKTTNIMETRNAERLGISLGDYTTLVKDEYWVSGEEAVRQNAADAVVNLHCDSSLNGIHDEVEQSPFGPVKIHWADCPAITGPLGFSFTGTPEQNEKIRSAIANYRQLRTQTVQ